MSWNKESNDKEVIEYFKRAQNILKGDEICDIESTSFAENVRTTIEIAKMIQLEDVASSRPSGYAGL